MKKDNGINPEQLNIYSGNSDPMKSIEMLGEVGRNLTSKKPRPRWVTIVAIILGLSLFISFTLPYLIAYI